MGFTRRGVLFALAIVGCTQNEGRHFRPPVPDTRAQSQPEGDMDFAKHATPPPSGKPDQVGLATWYGKELAGRPTSNGERFDPRAMTAAHRKLPFGTWVEVRRPDTGRSVRVRIND